PFYAFLFGEVCALLTAAKFVRDICYGVAPRDAARSACLETAGAVGPMFLALAALIFVFSAQNRVVIAAIVVSAAALGAALAAGWCAQYLNYSEQFIARANRAREWGERQAELLLWVTQTRWSLSVTGMAMVLAAIAFFGANGLHFQDGAPSIAYLAGAIAA